MRSGNRFAIIASLLLTLTFPVVLQAQSLAELAKKEKERRALVKTKVRVLSNTDVDKFQKGAVTTGVYGAEPPKSAESQPLAAPSAGASDAARTTPGEVVKDEAYWRTRYKEIVDKVRATENKSVLAQLQVNDLYNRFYREQDGFARDSIQRDIQKKLHEIDEGKKALAAAQRELEDFRREARRNNVPAGWIR